MYNAKCCFMCCKQSKVKLSKLYRWIKRKIQKRKLKLLEDLVGKKFQIENQNLKFVLNDSIFRTLKNKQGNSKMEAKPEIGVKLVPNGSIFGTLSGKT